MAARQSSHSSCYLMAVSNVATVGAGELCVLDVTVPVHFVLNIVHKC